MDFLLDGVVGVDPVAGALVYPGLAPKSVCHFVDVRIFLNAGA
jgi:hypothetical protein